MEFQTLLNDYCDKVGCTSKQLTELSGLSKSLISRYRNGERIPDIEGDGLKKIATAISSIARENNIEIDDVYSSMKNLLINAVDNKNEQSDTFAENFNYIMQILDISNSEMAKLLNVDSSFVSRIRNKKRKVNNAESLAHNIAEYIYDNYLSDNSKIFEGLFSKKKEEIENKSEFILLFEKWMLFKKNNNSAAITSFLEKLDEFDLNNYIKAIHFDTLRIPTSPITLPTSQKYYGIEKMKDGTIDFLKATVLSKKKDDVYIMSDMPMEKMAEDMEFGKKWMGGLALVIKKGITMKVIHCLDRPFEELMLGLESWIPLYMTGQIEPYYFKNRNNKTMCHLNYTSGVAALFGECVSGFQDEGMYYLTKKKDEVEYYKKRSDRLIEKADSLMKIYRSEHADKYHIYFEKINNEKVDRKSILSSPPLYTIPIEMLEKMLLRAQYTKQQKEKIIFLVNNYSKQMEGLLQENIVEDIITELDKNQFSINPVKLQLAVLGIECDIEYTWDEYSKHIKAIQKFGEKHQKYKFNISNERWYNNIQIMVLQGKYAIISKNNSPIINFIIEYPKLREAIENMVIAVKE